MKSDAGYSIGIVNPTTLVGNEIKTILRERSFPHARIALLDASGQSAGSLTEVDEEPVVVSPVAQEGLADLDLVFFCGPPATNREWIERYESDDFIAIDVSQPTSVDAGKLVVAGINLDELSEHERLLISPHPVTIPIALILRQIASLGSVQRCTAMVVQPASEFEQEGIEELAQQTIGVLNMQSWPKDVFDRQLAFNLFPAPARNEEIVVTQIKTLADARSEIALFVTQGTIFHGHTFSLFVQLAEDVAAEEVRSVLAKHAALSMPEGDQQFGTIDAAGRDEVLIAEVREDASIRGGFWIWAVCDNLRRSSALNAVLVAEKALFGAGVTH
jgi:aspartate-semialdehyde dehydrogenase